MKLESDTQRKLIRYWLTMPVPENYPKMSMDERRMYYKKPAAYKGNLCRKMRVAPVEFFCEFIGYKRDDIPKDAEKTARRLILDTGEWAAKKNFNLPRNAYGPSPENHKSPNVAGCIYVGKFAKGTGNRRNYRKEALHDLQIERSGDPKV